MWSILFTHHWNCYINNFMVYMGYVFFLIDHFDGTCIPDYTRHFSWNHNLLIIAAIVHHLVFYRHISFFFVTAYVWWVPNIAALHIISAPLPSRNVHCMFCSNCALYEGSHIKFVLSLKIRGNLLSYVTWYVITYKDFFAAVQVCSNISSYFFWNLFTWESSSDSSRPHLHTWRFHAFSGCQKSK